MMSQWLIRRRRPAWPGVLASVALGSIVGNVLGATPPSAFQVAGDTRLDTPRSAAFVEDVDSVIGLSNSTVVNLELDTTPGLRFSVVVPLDGEPYNVELYPYTVRAGSYQVLVQIADGSLVPAEPGPVRTLRGVVVEDLGSKVAGGMTDDGLTCEIFMGDGRHFLIEPIAGRVSGAVPGDHVIYRGQDAINSGGTCGTVETDSVDPNPGPVPHGGTLYCAELACDADVEYYNFWGSVSAVENRINTMTNACSSIYETDVNVTFVITAIIVRTAEPDPYTQFDSSALLCEFITEWVNNHLDLSYDHAKLFTGRNINGSTIGQAANIAEICERNGFCNPFFNGAYCYSQNDCCGSFACARELMAHELGHLWGGTHCCPGFIMQTPLGCNATHFDSGNITAIINHRNSVGCLDVGGCTGGCCISGAGCSDETQGDCIAAGGTFQGYGNICATTSCPGACCLSFGCITLSEDVCVLNNGVFQGEFVQCTPDPCPPLTGACCNDNDGSCVEMTQAACGAGNTYQGNGTDCSPNPCPLPTGACCNDNDGSCVEMTQAACGAGNTYQGNGTNCSPNPCPQPCLLLGDLNGSGGINGNDIPGFVRAKLGVAPEAGENQACADYGTGTLNGDIGLFVGDLLN